MIEYIEDLVVEVVRKSPPWIEFTDLKLFKSVSRQIAKSVALTDGQCRLINEKIEKYHDHMNQLCVVNEVKNKLRHPVRIIDRSRTISVERDLLSLNMNHTVIGVRFLYKTSIMNVLNKIRDRFKLSEYKVDKTHYFPYSEQLLATLINALRPMHFVLDSTAQHIYDTIQQFERSECTIGIRDYQLVNCSPTMVDHLENELGNIDDRTLMLYKDRSILYGIDWIDTELINRSKSYYSKLAVHIAHRERTYVQCAPDEYTYDHILVALNELDRKLIMIVLPKHSMEIIAHIHDTVSKYFDTSQLAAQSRFSDRQFNTFIGDNQLPSNITSDTRVLYVLDTVQATKPVEMGWRPNAIIMSETTKITNCMKLLDMYNNDVDLVVLHTDQVSSRLQRLH